MTDVSNLDSELIRPDYNNLQKPVKSGSKKTSTDKIANLQAACIPITREIAYSPPKASDKFSEKPDQQADAIIKNLQLKISMKNLKDLDVSKNTREVTRELVAENPKAFEIFLNKEVANVLCRLEHDDPDLFIAITTTIHDDPVYGENHIQTIKENIENYKIAPAKPISVSSSLVRRIFNAIISFFSKKPSVVAEPAKVKLQPSEGRINLWIKLIINNEIHKLSQDQKEIIMNELTKPQAIAQIIKLDDVSFISFMKNSTLKDFEKINEMINLAYKALMHPKTPQVQAHAPAQAVSSSKPLGLNAEEIYAAEIIFTATDLLQTFNDYETRKMKFKPREEKQFLVKLESEMNRFIEGHYSSKDPSIVEYISSLNEQIKKDLDFIRAKKKHF